MGSCIAVEQHCCYSLCLGRREVWGWWKKVSVFWEIRKEGPGLGGLGGGLIASNGVELQTLKGGWEMKCCLRKVEWVKRDEAIGKSVLK